MREPISMDQLSAAVKISKTWAAVCRILNRPPATGTQGHIKQRAVKAGVDFSHFHGQGHMKGKRPHNARPLSDYLVKDGPQINSDRLKKKLIAEGVKEHKCEDCLRIEWQGEPIPIELDHVDGDHWNNDPINLRFRCPNCHALKTATQRKINASFTKQQLTYLL